MENRPAIVVLGTFDSKGEEHLFLKQRIEQRGFPTLTINVGTKGPSLFNPDFDVFHELELGSREKTPDRDSAISAALSHGRRLLLRCYKEGRVMGAVSAGGGTGTHLSTGIMRVLPLGVPKVMVSTVASRNMAGIVGTKDITMMHSVSDILGINSILGEILDRAAGAVCGMAGSDWKPPKRKRLVGLTMFGFITRGAEQVKSHLESLGYEVIAFHANGTGGMAMEELAREGRFAGILDLATHEFADEFKQGYCRGIGSERLMPIRGAEIPRVVVPGGMDCAVLEFTRDNVPQEFRARKIFFYDFRSGIRLTAEESRAIAGTMAERLNSHPPSVKVLIPTEGWSEADCRGGALYDPPTSGEFVMELRRRLDPAISVSEVHAHINDERFAETAAAVMHEMIEGMDAGSGIQDAGEDGILSL
ncbi:MAG: UPF0261 family protein [Desulfobacteraceae bacterium]|nr:MAG: UPF0261 family protein [Desulfobacteraceae bacterium]